VQITYSREERIEVYHFSLWVTVLVPLFALVLQAFLPIRLHFFSIFDLPLLVTIFFAVARRSQISGLMTGAIIGLLQDSLTHQPLGVYGISKSVVGYAASSVGAKIDVENPGSRLLLTFCFYILHQLIFFAVARGLVGTNLQWIWMHEIRGAIANSIVAVVLFYVLDRFKHQ